MRAHDRQRRAGADRDEDRGRDEIGGGVMDHRSGAGMPAQHPADDPGQAEQRQAAQPQQDPRARPFVPVHCQPRRYPVIPELIGSA
jgi:hypothetical protein